MRKQLESATESIGKLKSEIERMKDTGDIRAAGAGSEISDDDVKKAGERVRCLEMESSELRKEIERLRKEVTGNDQERVKMLKTEASLNEYKIALEDAAQKCMDANTEKAKVEREKSEAVEADKTMKKTLKRAEEQIAELTAEVGKLKATPPREKDKDTGETVPREDFDRIGGTKSLSKRSPP